MIELDIAPELKIKYPGLKVLIRNLDKVKIKKTDKKLEIFKKEMITSIQDGYNINLLKNDPTIRAYRNFYWRIGIDPTKLRPASEALIRRIVANKPIPTINTFVDTYNLASIFTCIPLAAFDNKKIEGKLIMRKAHAGETFQGIGMKAPKLIPGHIIIISDQKKPVAIYPYRDADSTKITTDTKEVKLLVCGVPKIDVNKLKKAGDTAVEYVQKFCKCREK